METKYQEAINTIIGKNYPKPIVIHEEARAAALKAFQSLPEYQSGRGPPWQWLCPTQYEVTGSRVPRGCSLHQPRTV